MADLEEALESLISCPICMEDYTDPRILPCRHSFCENCLNGHIHDRARENKHTGLKTFRCPICRCKTRDKTDEHGDSGFPQSLAIIEILKSKETIINEEGNFSDTIEDIDQTGKEKGPETEILVKRTNRTKRRRRAHFSSRRKNELKKSPNKINQKKKQHATIVEAEDDGQFYIFSDSIDDVIITNAIIPFFEGHADNNKVPNTYKLKLFVSCLMLIWVGFFYPYSTTLM